MATEQHNHISDDADETIPVFFPRLATLLGSRENAKGSPLTEAEVLETRDSAPCIMMSKADWAKLPATYRDVEPLNAWADWHRVKSEFVSCFAPVIVFSAPILPNHLSQFETLLKSLELTYEILPAERRMANIFRGRAAKTAPPLTESDYQKINSNGHILEISSKPSTARECLATAFNFLVLAEQFIDMGALGICCQSSSVAHSNAAWKLLAETARNEFASEGLPSHRLAATLFEAFVQFPFEDDHDFFTSGMHLLGLPDLVIDRETLREPGDSEQQNTARASHLFWNFAIYLLLECREGQFHSGNTFSVEADKPKLRGIWEPYAGLAESDIRFNTFGRWRFVKP